MSIPYATVADLTKNVDERLLARLGSDTDEDGTVNDSNDILVGALTRASHEVRSFALRGGQYTSAQLDSLQTAGDGSLIGLVCDVALMVLLARRVRGEVPETLKMQLARANQTLIDLRDGKVIFAADSDVAGGKSAAGQATISIVTSTQRGSLNMMADQPFFPSRRTTSYAP